MPRQTAKALRVMTPTDLGVLMTDLARGATLEIHTTDHGFLAWLGPEGPAAITGYAIRGGRFYADLGGVERAFPDDTVLMITPAPRR